MMENQAELEYDNFSLSELADQLESTQTKYRLARIVAKALLDKRITEHDINMVK